LHFVLFEVIYPIVSAVDITPTNSKGLPFVSPFLGDCFRCVIENFIREDGFVYGSC